MTELDLEIPGLAAELIAEFGKEIIYTTINVPTYNPETGLNNATENPPLTIKAIVEDYDLVGSGSSFASGLIESGDKKLTIARESLPVEPTPEDTCSFDGVNYKIENIKGTYSGELIAIYTLQARRT